MSTSWDWDDPDARREGVEPAPLQRALARLVSRRRWNQRLHGARVHEHWEEIAGPSLARHATPVRLHGGVLVVRVESSAWAAQLRYLVPQLVARANDVLGSGSVSTVTISTGVQPPKPP